MKTILFFLFLLSSCDLQNRYPKEGEFCELNQNPAPCFYINFREKQMVLNEKSLPLHMIFRVKYEFNYEGKDFILDVLGEHRLGITEKGNSEYQQKIFNRKKPTKKSKE